MEASSTAEFAGRDRRRHRIYVTKNTEYHFRDGFCIAVRDGGRGTSSRGTSRSGGGSTAGSSSS